MPQAQPLPRKYLSRLEQARDELRRMALQARAALEEIEAQRRPFQQARSSLRDIEALAYRLALNLSELEVAGACDGCPSAPPTTQAQAQLLVLADVLERQAALAREHALGRAEITLALSQQELHLETVSPVPIERREEMTIV